VPASRSRSARVRPWSRSPTWPARWAAAVSSTGRCVSCWAWSAWSTSPHSSMPAPRCWSPTTWASGCGSAVRGWVSRGAVSTRSSIVRGAAGGATGCSSYARTTSSGW